MTTELLPSPAMASAELDVSTLSYIAGVIDMQGLIRTRMSGDTELPLVQMHGSNERLLSWLASLTGVRSIITRRSFARVGCSEHCREKHQHVTSVSGRWTVTGYRATVLLWNIRPYLWLQADEARSAIEVGLAAPFKPAMMKKMADLGWDIPPHEVPSASHPTAK